jgi:UPF0271 protein
MSLQHIKPHGALYMHLARDEEAARVFVQTLRQLDRTCFFCMHGSAVWRVAQELQQAVVCEFYADRDYDNSGSIVFTRRVGALDPAQVAAKVLRACREGVVRTVEGRTTSPSHSTPSASTAIPPARWRWCRPRRAWKRPIAIAAPR